MQKVSVLDGKHKVKPIKSSLNSAKILKFKKETGEFLAKLLHDFLEKLPLKYTVACSTVYEKFCQGELF